MSQRINRASRAVRRSDRRTAGRLFEAALQALEARQLFSAALLVTDNSGAGADGAISFAATEISQTAGPLTFTLTNNGDSDLSIDSLAIGGASAADFTVVSLDGEGNPIGGNSFVIAAGQSDTVQVSYHPSVTGAEAAAITFNSNDASNPAVSLALSGSGADSTAPDAQLSASDLTDVGTQFITFTVTYTDNLAVDHSTFDDNDIVVTGPDSTEYSAVFISSVPLGDASSMTATYRLDAPDVEFTSGYNGQYTVSLADGEVTDTSGNAIVGQSLGTFDVDVTDVPTIPAAPSGAVANAVLYNRVDVFWTDNSDNEDGFNIYHATSADGPFTLIRTVGPNARFSSFTGLTANTSHYYRVTAFNDVGESANTSDFDTTAVVPVDRAGSTLTTARNAGTINGSVNLWDYVGSIDSTDMFRFTLSLKATTRLTLGSMVDDADLQLFKVGPGNTLTSLSVSEKGGTASEYIIKSLAAGTYAVKVMRGSSAANTKFCLNVNADYAGNTRTAARSLGAISSTRTWTDFVGNSDHDDYYKITLGKRSTLSLALTGLTADADVALLSSTGSVIKISENNGTASESISRLLNAGTYYIRIYQFGDTNYKLSLGAR